MAVVIIVAVCVSVGLTANPRWNAASGTKESELQNQKDTTDPKTQKQPVGLTNFEIADGKTVLSNGRKVSVRLVMTNGKYYDQSQVPYGGNAYDNNYQGNYEIQVLDSEGKLLSKVALYNTDGGTEAINFPGKFNLLFDDYNRDGNPDFTIGQWYSSGAKQYQIFTVMPYDSIKEISKADIVLSCDYSDIKNCSVKFEKDGTSGFYTTVYFNGNASGNRWQKFHYVCNDGTNNYQIMS